MRFQHLSRSRFAVMFTYARTVARASIDLGVQRLETRAADKFRTNDRHYCFIDIDRLTAGSDEKRSAAQPGIEPRVLRILVARSNHWATKPQRELRVWIFRQFGESRKFTRSSRCGFVAQWLESATRIRKTLSSIPGGLRVFFVWFGVSSSIFFRSWKRREFDVQGLFKNFNCIAHANTVKPRK